MRSLAYVLLLLLLAGQSFAQTDTLPQRMYKVDLRYELPASALFITGSYFGFRRLDEISSISADKVATLNPDDLNALDRPVAFMDPKGFDKAQKQSDLFLNISILSPALLALDKNVRKDWVDLIAMYMMTHAVDNAIYFAAAYSVRRARPLTYNPELATELKTGAAKTNSFFSGHVSFSATSTFFAAKVFTDYHHIKGVKRLMIYTVASVPPLLVGYYRMKAGKHFRTDVGLGFLVGAASGILIPELHRNIKQHKKVSVQPFYMAGYSGMSLSVGL